MTSGKCIGCAVIYKWAGGPLLRDANCIHCSKPLRRVARTVPLKKCAVGNGKCKSAMCGYSVTCAIPRSIEDIERETLQAEEKARRINANAERFRIASGGGPLDMQSVRDMMIPTDVFFSIFGKAHEVYRG